MQHGTAFQLIIHGERREQFVLLERKKPSENGKAVEDEAQH